MSAAQKTPVRQESVSRVVIENVQPRVDCGRYPAKRTIGEQVAVEADCFAEGHDMLACAALYRYEQERAWQEVPMTPLGNDRWRACFLADRIGRWRFTVTAWVDPLSTWQHDFARRVDIDDQRLAARVGADLIAPCARRASGEQRRRLDAWAARLRDAGAEIDALRALALDEALLALALRHAPRTGAHTFEQELEIVVDRSTARYSTWYELFPRSCAAAVPGLHGTFADVQARLGYISKMGFDVLYLPPIHPIGRERRKGKNNAVVAAPDEAGSPWAIGSAEGGHKALHPELGTLEEFRALLEAARIEGMEIALDIAFQCAPDHPYVTEHPEWFRRRPDGTVQYAENPPKKYQDIYPLNFESEDWEGLWRELRSVFAHWIEQGVRIFRVDNPHTKPFAFWEWVIADLKREHPHVLFLAEAFTRPRVMHRLAKIGFTQSYTYFTWRNTKQELTEYFTELTQQAGREYFRPNCWPNTPDILPESLQTGLRSAFMTRLTLAATLAANYGIYGPAFELMESAPREPGSEEYLNSEKYEIREWNLARGDSLAAFIERVNRIRRDNAALQSDWSLRFHSVGNDALICYSKTSADDGNTIVTVVNLDPRNVQSGWVDLDLAGLEVEVGASYQMHDLLSGARYLWHGSRNFVRLDPGQSPAHIFALRRHARTERDFDYFA